MSDYRYSPVRSCSCFPVVADTVGTAVAAGASADVVIADAPAGGEKGTAVAAAGGA